MIAERCIDSVKGRSFSAEFDGLENLINSLLDNKEEERIFIPDRKIYKK